LDANALSARIQEAWEKGDNEHAKFLEGQRKKDMKHLQLLADRRKANYADLARTQSRTMAEQADAFSGKLERGISGLFSGNINIAGMIKGAGQAGQRRGDAAILKGNDPDATKRDKQMATLGKTMATIGTGLMGLGAVTGILTVLVKAFVDLHDRVADINASFMSTAGAADFGFGGAAHDADKLTARIDEVRESVLDVSKLPFGPNLQGWGQSSGDLFAILGAMNEMNFSFERMEKNIEGNIEGLSSFADHAIRAVAYGKLLGVEGREMGQNMAQMANEFGVGLDVISEGLHAVHREAMLSGFSTKRFYSTVLELTSGLGAYNVRLEEAANLLGLVGQVAGEGEAGGMIKKHGTGMEQMSITERLQKLLLQGGKDNPTTKRIFTDDAKASAGAFYKALKDNKNFDGTELLKLFGLDVGGGMDAFVKQFMKIKPGQRQKLRDALFADNTGLGSDASEISDIADRGVAKSAAGKGDMARQVEALSFLGPAAQMAMKMQLPILFKGVKSSLGALMMTGSEEAQAAAEAATGMSAQELQELGAMQSKMMANFNKFAAMSEDQLNAQGVTRTGKGAYRRRDQTTGEVSGDVFKDWLGLLLASNDEVEHMTKAALTHDQKVAKDTSDRTAKLATVLEENVASILNDIYVVVRDILNFLLGSSEKKNQLWGAGQKLIQEFAADEEKAKTALKKAQDAHTTAQNTPGADTKATAAAVSAAQADVNKYAALGEKARTIDPTSAGTYENYKAQVYAQAGYDQNAGGEKGKKNRERREKETRGKSFWEAVGDDGLTGAATWAAGMESGSDSYSAFKSQIEEFAQETGMSGSDKQIILDYWKDKYLRQYEQDHPLMFGVQPEAAMLFDPGAVAQSVWESATGGRASLIADMSTMGSGVEGMDTVIAKYRAGLEDQGKRAASIPDDHSGEDRRETDWGPVIPSMNDMFVPTNGRPVALNSADQVLAMKPGGAIDRVLGGRGGGGSPVTINIKWTGDEALVRRAVIEGINIARGKPFA